MLNISAFLFLVLLYRSVLGENVETRIHYLMKPTAGSQNTAFGTSLIATGNPKVVYAGAPKVTSYGGMYTCPFTFNTLQNVTNNCVNFITFGSANSSTGLTMEKVRSQSKDFVLVCGNQYTFSCPTLQIQQRMIGECYSYNTADEAKETLPSPCPIGCPLGLVADIVFVLDGSGSVGSTNFKTGLRWVVDVLKRFSYDIDRRNVRVGYVVYENSITTRQDLQTTTFYTLKEEVLKIAYPTGGTDTAEGIQTATSILTTSTANPKAAKIMITVTDGNSNSRSETSSAAVFARNQGITMIAVGVGTGISLRELQLIATGIVHDNTRVMTVSNYDNLDSILDKLSQVIKETASTSLEGGTSNSTTELTQCQIGNSAHATANSLFIGATGSYDRTGTVAEYSDISKFPYSISSGHINSTELETMLGFTNDTQLKDSYFGYSVSSGRLTGNEWIAMGAPRYLSKGLAMLYRKGNKQINVALHPREESGFWQLGAYFGHSVLVMDVNNDGRDDLLVSSPLFSKTAGYDEGIVFVYLNNPASPGPSHWMTPSYTPVVLKGDSVSGGRFGMSVVNGGDIDKNSIDDVIIGAPFEKSSEGTGSGAVYIYFGSSSGLSSSRVQKILGKSVSTQILTGFGSAIYGGIDFDDNGYPDIAVAAPSSDRIVLLRSRKLIAVTSTITVSPTTINVINCLRTLTSSCSLIRVCLTAAYEGTSGSETFGIAFNVTLDSLIGDSSQRRFQFINTRSSVKSESEVMVGTSQVCREYNMNFKATALGKLNGGGLETIPRVRLNIDFSNTHKSLPMSGVLSSRSSSIKEAEWTFQKGCSGTNGKCVHDLEISANYSETASSTPLVLDGTSKKLIVNVDIRNRGPDHAYFLKINVTSGNLTVIKVSGSCAEISDDEGDSSIGLTVIKYKSSTSALSDLMPSNDRCNFSIEFDFAKLQSTANERDFSIRGVIYSNAGGSDVAVDRKMGNSEINFTRSLMYKSVVILDGSSAPEKVFFNSSLNVSTIRTLEDDVLGGNKTNVVHTYSIYNNGPLGLANSQIKLSWPEKTKDGFYLFYLVDLTCQPQSACSCMTSGKTNRLNIKPKETSVGSYVDQVTIDHPTPEQALNSKDPVTCNSTKCSDVFCNVNFLPIFEKVTFLARFKPWVPTYGKSLSETKIYSRFQLLTSNITLPLAVSITREEVATTLSHYDPTIPPPEPTTTNNIGAIIGGILAGLVLLAIAIAVMWKTGFFKSKYGQMTRDARQSIRQSPGNGGEGTDAGGAEGQEPSTTNPQMNKSTEVLYENN